MRGPFSFKPFLAYVRSGPRLLILGLALVTLSALYLALPARDVMNVTSAIAILIHIGLGLLITIPAGVALFRLCRRSAVIATGGRRVLLAAGFIAIPCAFTGIFLTLRAAWGISAAHDSWAGIGHIVCGVAALLLLCGFLLSQARITRRMNLSVASRTSAASSLPTLLLLLLLCQGGLWAGAALLPEYIPDYYYRDLTATNADQAQNPLFPAGLRLRAANGTEPQSPLHWNLPTSDSCGRAGCHKQEFQEWQVSGHRFAGTDVFYQSVLQRTASKSGRQSTLWCQGCHAPHVVLTSVEPEATSRTLETASAEGVGCYSCHAAVGTPTRTGNGHFILAEPQDYPFGNSVGWKRNLHDFLLRVRPGPHQRAYLKPDLHTTAEFCSSCHRQSFSVAQNHYQFVRGADEFGEWQESAFSGRTARPSALITRPNRTCQDCHFPGLLGGHFDHSLPGGNSALPALYIDNLHQTQTENYLREKISLDLFALRRQQGADRSEHWIAPLDGPLAPYSLHPGETWTLDVLVTNRGVGHNFPTGYTDIKEAWLEIRLMDGTGRTVLSNGVLSTKSVELPPDTYAYRSLRLDRTGNAVLFHDLFDQVTTAYSRTIASGSSDVARYAFTLPGRLPNGKPLTGPLRLSARLRYRSLRPDFARWALTASTGSSMKQPSTFIPPITILAETSVTFPIYGPAQGARPRSKQDRNAQSERFVRYGNAMLGQTEKPDLSRALRAFHTANALAPDRAEPLLGLGRVFLTEPDLRLAALNLSMALKKDPGSSAAAADLSVVYNKQGQHEQAIKTLEPLLLKFPQDGKLQFDFGLALFKAGRYEQASEAFQHALAADPDNSAAHFQLKRCNEVIRRVTDARREDSITRYLAEDKLAPMLVPRYLSNHSDARQSAQPFPVHALRPVH